MDKLPEIRVEEVRLDATSGTLKVGERLQLSAVVLPEHAPNRSVIWSVYGEHSQGIAAVSESGLIEAKAPGEATIRAMSAADANRYADFRLTVREADKPIDPPVSEIWLNYETKQLKTGETLQLTATVLPETVSDRSVIWSIVGEKDVASVTESGLVTALRPGTVHIRATSRKDPVKHADLLLTVTRDPENPEDGTDEPDGPDDTAVAPGQPGPAGPVSPGASSGNGQTEVSAGKLSIAAKVEASTAKVQVRPEDLEQARKEAAAGAGSDRAEVVRIEVQGAQGANTVEVTLPKQAIAQQTADRKLEIVTPFGSVTLPSDFLKDTNAADTDFIQLIVALADSAGLSDEARKQVGNRPILSIEVREEGAYRPWSNPDTAVRISIPYKPTAAELSKPGSLVVRYIDGSGRSFAVPSGKYDAATGTVQFEVKHFSKYAVAYVDKSFADIAEYTWAKLSIEALAAREIIRGMDADVFAPSLNITRADFVAMLVRTMELEAAVTGNFKDVSRSDYFYDTLGIARELGIIEGIGEGNFQPRGYISRQDMFTITARALNAARDMKIGASVDTLSVFQDRAEVASYAADSVAGMVKEGLIQGDGRTLNPQGNATRAEVAVFMYRILNNMYK